MDLLGVLIILAIIILVLVSIIFGLILGRFVIVGNRKNTPREETTVNNTQLAKIHRAILEGTCVSVVAISVAAIVAAVTIPTINIVGRGLLYGFGVAGIVYSIVRYYIRRR